MCNSLYLGKYILPFHSNNWGPSWTISDVDSRFLGYQQLYNLEKATIGTMYYLVVQQIYLLLKYKWERVFSLVYKIEIY